MIIDGPGGDTVEDPENNPMMLKLHGSINWHCISEEYRRVLRGEETDLGKIWYDTDCPSIDDDHSPCIIPPIEAKPVTKPSLFKDLWSKAHQYLGRCRELYVCGYSLPHTDAFAASLFKNFQNDRLERVTVIDADASVMERWRSLLAREDVSKAKWSYYSDFAEFVYDDD